MLAAPGAAPGAFFMFVLGSALACSPSRSRTDRCPAHPRHRLQSVEKRSLEKLMELEAFASPLNNYSALRAELAAVNPPCVPYLVSGELSVVSFWRRPCAAWGGLLCCVGPRARECACVLCLHGG